MIFGFIGVVLRILAVIYCIRRAGELNRSPAGWGIFAFFMPIIAIIVIQSVGPVVKKMDHEPLDSNL